VHWWIRYSLLDFIHFLICHPALFQSRTCFIVYIVFQVFTPAGHKTITRAGFLTQKHPMRRNASECVYYDSHLWIRQVCVCVCLCETFQIFLILFLPFIFLKRCCPDTSKSAHTHTHTHTRSSYSVTQAVLMKLFCVFDSGFFPSGTQPQYSHYCIIYSSISNISTSFQFFCDSAVNVTIMTLGSP